MARAFALATEAGRLGCRAGRGPVGAATAAEASSPLTGFLGVAAGRGGRVAAGRRPGGDGGGPPPADAVLMAAPKGRFARHLDTLDVPGLSARTYTDADVTAALGRDNRDLADLAALLSPGRPPPGWRSSPRRRGRRRCAASAGPSGSYAPLYVSNECLSSCTYCGFAKGLPIARRTLSVDGGEAEAALLTGRGFRHLLLVAGEHRVEVSQDYLVEVRRAAAAARCRRCRSRPRPGPTTRTTGWSPPGWRASCTTRRPTTATRYARRTPRAGSATTTAGSTRPSWPPPPASAGSGSARCSAWPRTGAPTCSRSPRTPRSW